MDKEGLGLFAWSEFIFIETDTMGLELNFHDTIHSRNPTCKSVPASINEVFY